MIDECLIERFKSLSVDDKLNFLAQMIVEIRYKVEATSTSQLRHEEDNLMNINNCRICGSCPKILYSRLKKITNEKTVKINSILAFKCISCQILFTRKCSKEDVLERAQDEKGIYKMIRKPVFERYFPYGESKKAFIERWNSLMLR